MGWIFLVDMTFNIQVKSVKKSQINASYVLFVPFVPSPCLFSLSCPVRKSKGAQLGESILAM